jgi:hypothetical protein
LIASAERRHAYKKALAYLDLAERADPVDPGVRRARLRMRFANLARRLRQGKIHLTGEDFAAIHASPDAAQGDRPAMVAALAWADAIAREQADDVRRLRDEVIQLMGGVAGGHALLGGVARACGMDGASPAHGTAPAGEIAVQLARACALGRDAGIPCEIVPEWEHALIGELAAPACTIDTARLRALAESAVDEYQLGIAYAAAGAGLRQGGPAVARFLFLRGRSLSPFGLESRRLECFRAAAELARRQGDRETAEDVNRVLADMGAAVPGQHAPRPQNASGDEAQRILEREKASVGDPLSGGESRRRAAGPPDLSFLELEPGEPGDTGEPDDGDFGLGPMPSPEAFEKLLEELFSQQRKPRRGRKGPRPPF